MSDGSWLISDGEYRLLTYLIGVKEMDYAQMAALDAWLRNSRQGGNWITTPDLIKMMLEMPDL